MADPRDLAQQWLAEVLSHAGCADSAGFVYAPVGVLAAAILDQPGVEVDANTTLYVSSGRREVHVVIGLPVQTLDGGR